ncbi:RNA polymerase sigma factor [Belnapia sp. T6]|uniref:RNA polymerase sigma factor n=1 Tax=Belnapia mucosa TaxID=2804532 RepID=A0ABS1V578_9PROT|nr:RNA polymerase sigma factor [Belnapia mucosa]MBL6456836.1 RNA polymerase sigma factor [Belnapia mucosa]
MPILSTLPLPFGLAPAPPAAPRPVTDAAASDAALMAAAAGGDRAAFNLLVGRHGERVLRIALRILPDQGEAEEVAQEAFLRAWQAAPGFDPARARFTTWLHRITVNLAIDRTRRRPPSAPRPIEEAAETPDPAPGPEAEAEAAESRAALAAALGTLPPRQRAAIALAYEQELSGAEAAAALRVSERALEGLLRRARQLLRRRLEEG